MSILLHSVHARAIAQSAWGGEPRMLRCNRRGASWAECSRHGGMIVDMAALSREEIALVEAHARPGCERRFTLWFNDDPAEGGKPVAFFHDGRRKMLRTRSSWVRVEGRALLFERDVDWAVPVHLLGLGPARLLEPDARRRAAELFLERSVPAPATRAAVPAEMSREEETAAPGA